MLNAGVNSVNALSAKFSQVVFILLCYHSWLIKMYIFSYIRASGTGLVGPAMAGPTFWQKYKIFVSTRHISAPPRTPLGELTTLPQTT